MTSEQALTYITGLEKSLKGEFDAEEMNAVWPRLLACDSQALACASAVVARSHKRLLPPEALARMVEFQHRRLHQEAEPALKPLPADLEEGKEVFRLHRDLYAMPGLTLQQHKQRLLELADRFNKLDYARQAEAL